MTSLLVFILKSSWKRDHPVHNLSLPWEGEGTRPDGKICAKKRKGGGSLRKSEKLEDRRRKLIFGADHRLGEGGPLGDDTSRIGEGVYLVAGLAWMACPGEQLILKGFEEGSFLGEPDATLLHAIYGVGGGDKFVKVCVKVSNWKPISEAHLKHSFTHAITLNDEISWTPSSIGSVDCIENVRDLPLKSYNVKEE